MKNSALLLITLTFLFACTNKEEKASWAKHFTEKSVTGTMILYNTQTDSYQYHNIKRADSAFLPASTFKIFNSLVSLQEKSVADEYEVIKWDSVDYGWDVWHKDYDMKQAMPYSCVWFYQELARRTGEEKMQLWLDSVGYGNKTMGADIDLFWLEGDLKISASEQIAFINKLIKKDLPFDKKHQQTVKELMLVDSTETYQLYAKTGWGMTTPEIGWYVGFVEKAGNTWIFSLNLNIIKEEDKNARKDIVYSVLREEGIVE